MKKTYSQLCSEFGKLDFKPVFDENLLNKAKGDLPKDFIPAGAEITVGIDRALGRDMTCKGYWKDSAFFVHEFIEVIHEK